MTELNLKRIPGDLTAAVSHKTGSVTVIVTVAVTDGIVTGIVSPMGKDGGGYRPIFAKTPAVNFAWRDGDGAIRRRKW